MLNDGRTKEARALRQRLSDYWLQVTDGGQRKLRPSEVLAIKTVVNLEVTLDSEMAANAIGRTTGNDAARLASELRRASAVLAFMNTGQATDDGQKPSADDKHANEVRGVSAKLMAKINRILQRAEDERGPVIHFPRRTGSTVRELGPIDIKVEQFTSEERNVIEAAVRRIASQVKQEERTSHPPTPEETIETLKLKIEQLKSELQAVQDRAAVEAGPADYTDDPLNVVALRRS